MYGLCINRIFKRLPIFASLAICLALPGQGRLHAQDFESWKKAVEMQYGAQDAVIRYKYTDIDFRPGSRPSGPETRIRVTQKIAPASSTSEVPFSIVLDSHTSIRKIRTDGRRIKAAGLEISNYAQGALLHSDIRLAHFNLRFGKRYREQRVRYKLILDDIRYLAPLYIHDRYAVYESAIRIRRPQWLDLDIVEFNMDDSLKYKRIESVNSKNVLSYELQAYSFEPGFSVEKAPPPSYIYPHLLFVPRSYADRRGEVVVFKDLIDLYSWYRYLMKDIDNEEIKFDKYLDNVLKSQAVNEEKMEAVYYWVQENIRYLAYENGIAGYRPQSASLVYENRFGDCKGMANLTKYLLQRAGLDARLGWLGSRYLVYNFDYPALAVDNHVICAVSSGDGWIFLDPTESFISAGTITENIAGREVMIENGEDYIMARIPGADTPIGKVYITAELYLLRDEVLQGKARLMCSGAAKHRLMEQVYGTDTKEDVLNSFFQPGERMDFRFSDNEWNSWKSTDREINLNIELAARHAGSAFGNEIFLDLSSFGLPEPPYIDPNRKYDFLPGRSWDTEAEIDVILPSGYSLKYLPKPLKIENGPLQLEFEMNATEHGFILNYKYQNPGWSIARESFSDWNAAHEQLARALRDHIIIRKQ